MRTSLIGSGEAQNIQDHISDIIEYFDEDQEVAWTFSISENTSDIGRTLDKLREALSQLEAIDNEEIEEHNIEEVWDLQETLQDLNWLMEKKLEKQEKQPNKSLSDYQEGQQ